MILFTFQVLSKEKIIKKVKLETILKQFSLHLNLMIAEHQVINATELIIVISSNFLT